MVASAANVVVGSGAVVASAVVGAVVLGGK